MTRGDDMRRSVGLIAFGLSAILIAVGCGVITVTPASTSSGPTVTAADDHTADWDLSHPKTPAELGGSNADLVVAVETLGTNGVQVHLTLPGGDVVDRRFRLATASAGLTDKVSSVELDTTHLSPAERDQYIEAFVTQFGGSRSDIKAYLTKMNGPTAVSPLFFYGDARPGYQPSLQIRDGDEDGFVVAWNFDLSA